MTEYNHYDCKHFQVYHDGIGVDCYCHRKKEWFWIVEKTPICEYFEEKDGDVE